MAEKIFILYGCTSRKLAEAKPAMGAIDACRRAIGLPQTSPDAAGAAMEGQMDLGKHLQDLLQRNVAQITSNLRQASSHAAQLCQQAFMQPPNCAPLLGVSPAAGWALGVSPQSAGRPVPSIQGCRPSRRHHPCLPAATPAATHLQSVSARLAGAPRGAVAAARAAAQPLFDLAFNPEEIKARLNSVPVFAVVNNKNEFVLVAGEVRAES
jgi:hypothetical protein